MRPCILLHPVITSMVWFSPRESLSAAPTDPPWVWPLRISSAERMTAGPDMFLGLGGRGATGVGLGWESGTFGFVRQPLVWQGNTLFTLFHEGIDLAPTTGNGKAGEDVVAASTGRVFGVSDSPLGGHGRWVLLEHTGAYAGLFSRYAHLNAVSVQKSERIAVGQRVGTLGWSGTGVTRERAHLHFELGFMLHSKFHGWHRRTLPHEPETTTADYRNFGQIEPLSWLKAHASGLTDRPPSLAEIVALQPVGFQVTIPRPRPNQKLDLLVRCPWLWQDPAKLPDHAETWRLCVTAWGLPTKITAAPAPAPTTPIVTWVEPFAGKHAWRTQGLLEGSGPTATLAPRGKLWLSMLLYADPGDP